MSRILAQHGIEQFVYSWLSKFRNASDLRNVKKYMEKAVQQIQFFLDPPCCDDPNASVDYRRLDNDLTRFISAQLAQANFDRRKWRKSLERTISALNNKIADPCCQSFVSISYEFTVDEGVTNPILRFVSEDESFSQDITEGGNGTVNAPIGVLLRVYVLSDIGQDCSDIAVLGDGVEPDDFNCNTSGIVGCIDLSFTPLEDIGYVVTAFIPNSDVCGE